MGRLLSGACWRWSAALYPAPWAFATTCRPEWASDGADCPQRERLSRDLPKPDGRPPEVGGCRLAGAEGRQRGALAGPPAVRPYLSSRPAAGGANPRWRAKRRARWEEYHRR